MVRATDGNSPIGGVPIEPENNGSNKSDSNRELILGGLAGSALPDTSATGNDINTIDHPLIPAGLIGAIENSNANVDVKAQAALHALEIVKGDPTFGCQKE
ncbi:MAG: hypothetical protein ACI9S8_000505 [Chlamydiales bacterium]|jgi:hypothetical protein